MAQTQTKPKGTGATAEPPAGQPSPVPSSSAVNFDLLDSAADYSTKQCAVNVFPDGSGEATFAVDADIMRRLRLRANGRNLADYIWTEVVRAALNGHVY